MLTCHNEESAGKAKVTEAVRLFEATSFADRALQTCFLSFGCLGDSAKTFHIVKLGSTLKLCVES